MVDLCTGSGAIALSVADEVPGAQVHAVELDPDAHAWAAAQPGRERRSTCGSGDMADAFPDLDGTVDVVVCNPPYIPLEACASVAPEARDHDPAPGALVRARTASTRCGCSSTAAPAAAARVAGSAPSTPTSRASPRRRVFAATGRWADVRDHLDLAGRARFVTARLAR